jgi:hypothetical protein
VGAAEGGTMTPDYRRDLLPSSERPPARCVDCGRATYAPPLCVRCALEKAVVRGMVREGMRDGRA